MKSKEVPLHKLDSDPGFHEGSTDPESISDPLESLLTIGRENQGVTVDDILEHFPDVGENPSQMNELLSHLEERDIELFLEDREGRGGRSPFSPERSDGNQEKIDNLIRVQDTTGIYMQEVGSIPLLSKEEEVNLSKRIERGHKAREQMATSRESRNKRQLLQALVEDGSAAFEHLITANSRLVMSVARKYLGRGVPFPDLIQEGNIGLIRAAKKFDYHRGLKFSTYATWWVRQAITRAIADQGRTIRVPVHMGDQINRMLRANHALTQDLGREPRAEELAQVLHENPKKVERMKVIAQLPLSLETPTGENEDSELAQFIEDENAAGPDDAERRLLQEQMRELLDDELPPREKTILELRYGIRDGHQYTLEEIGQKMGVTRERIRQIEAQALRRLRHIRHHRRLIDYLR